MIVLGASVESERIESKIVLSGRYLLCGESYFGKKIMKRTKFG